MADWSASMQQTFEYYVVDPGTWMDVRKINNIKSCTINRDAEVETLGSATIDTTESLGECYIRVYLVIIQNGVTEKHPLGTFLVQTPQSSFDGKTHAVSVDAYTPLIELKENLPPLGYSIPKDENVMSMAYRLTREYVRAPVVATTNDAALQYDFVAETSETWLKYISALIANADYKFELDELGRILFAPKQDIASLQPVWTYDDGNSSILYPEISLSRDLYGIPNVVEVIYSNGNDHYHATAVNDDPNSPTSTVSRGRRITTRDDNPDVIGYPTKDQINEYAERRLKELSSIECSISYMHAYCPTRLGDCVRLNYKRSGFTDIKAKVISQSIKCEPGCPVTEKATFTTKLWG